MSREFFAASRTQLAVMERHRASTTFASFSSLT
jgi:hypothetical protein